jgi:pimeloyl-ACP methyl ester carboxylesterase
VQFAFDPLEDRRRGRYAPDDQEFTIALTEKGPNVARYSAGRPGEVPSAKLAAVRKPEGAGVRYELAIPWAEIEPLAPRLRRSFGFTFSLCDSDGRHIKSWLEWTSGICAGKDPASFGQVLLRWSPPRAGTSELFLASRIPERPDVDTLSFHLSRTATRNETLRGSFVLLTSDNQTALRGGTEIPLTPGTVDRELVWRIPRLADGSYTGTITVEPDPATAPRSAGTRGGPPVVRRFSYERLMTAPLCARLDAVRGRMATLCASRPGPFARVEPGLRFRFDVADCWLSGSADLSRWRRLPVLVDEAEKIVDALARGTDWFDAQRGRLTKAYLAPEDDSLQPYRLEVPADYDGSKPFPLVVLLHGYGGPGLTFDLWYEIGLRESKTPPRPGYITVIPYGRGNTGWVLLGRNDVFHVVDEVRRSYRIDPDRVYVQGFSMGGSGTWYLATRYPDRWAACGPQAGGVGLGAWRKFGDRKTQPETRQDRLSVAGSQMFALENLLDLPTACYHGVDDETVGYENTEAAFQRLRELRYEAALFAAVREGHTMPQALRDGLIDWMLKFKRDAAPERIVYRTCDLRHNAAYWVEIDELVEDYRLAEVKADWSDPARIAVEASNVRRLTLRLDPKRFPKSVPLTVSVNGKEVDVAHPPSGVSSTQPGGWVHLVIADDGKDWSRSDEQYRAGLIKRHGLSGPISEAFGDRFLIVYGTTGGAEATEVNRAEAQALAERMTGADWGQYYGKFTPRADNEITDADVASSNLILFGGPDCNGFTRRIAEGLPVKLSGGKPAFRGKELGGADVAVRFIYPNPANPGRYVVVHCGATPAAIRNIARAGSDLDWLVFDAESSRRRSERKDPPYSDAGFFDRDWR